MMETKWSGMDKDDIPGCLMDHVAKWLEDHGVDSIDGHYDSYQLDSYRDALEELVDEVVEATLEYNNEQNTESKEPKAHNPQGN